MNPCGAICDYGRRPYTTTARPFRNSQDTVQLVWYPAREDAPVLPFPSAFNSLDYTADPIASYTVGEVYGTPRNYNGQKMKPEALGEHNCGDERDYAEGCVRDTSLPPVVYKSNGLPECCGYDPPVTPARHYKVTFNAEERRLDLWPYGSMQPVHTRGIWGFDGADPPFGAGKTDMTRFPSSSAPPSYWAVDWAVDDDTTHQYATGHSLSDVWDGLGCRDFVYITTFGPAQPHPSTVRVCNDGET